MEKNRPAYVSFENLSQKGNLSAIENFIVVDSAKAPTNIVKSHPIVFDGLIFGICLKGTGKVKINFREYEIEANNLFTILPNVIFEWQEGTEDFFVEVLVFSIDFFIGLPLPKDFDIVRNISNRPVFGISEKEMEDLLEFHSFIVKAYNRERHVYTTSVVRSLLLALLSEIGAIYRNENIEQKSKSTTRNEELVTHFFELLKDHYQQERSASFYADQLYITSKHLSGILKKVTGRSINYWIDEAVIIGAKLLLKTTDLTVLQISEEMNFPNPSFFGKFFKHHVGMTPVAYREL